MAAYRVWLAAGALALAACGANQNPTLTEPGQANQPVPFESGGSTTIVAPSSTSSAPPVVEIRLRIERRVSDPETEGFEQVVATTIADPRGWTRAGFAFAIDPSAEYVIVLAEAAEVDQLCLPYDTKGLYSCQNGAVVAFNADRWRTATPEWTGDLATYREMLVNHEVGHLLGQHHPPEPQCPQPGQPAPVMAQQSTELEGCLPNPWPLEHEVTAAARHDQPLAPPYQKEPDG